MDIEIAGISVKKRKILVIDYGTAPEIFGS